MPIVACSLGHLTLLSVTASLLSRLVKHVLSDKPLASQSTASRTYLVTYTKQVQRHRRVEHVGVSSDRTTQAILAIDSKSVSQIIIIQSRTPLSWMKLLKARRVIYTGEVQFREECLYADVSFVRSYTDRDRCSEELR